MKVFSSADVAALTGLHVETIRQHLRSGRLPAKRIGRTFVVGEADVRRWMAEKRKPGRPRKDESLRARLKRQTPSERAAALAAYDQAMREGRAEHEAGRVPAQVTLFAPSLRPEESPEPPSQARLLPGELTEPQPAEEAAEQPELRQLVRQHVIGANDEPSINHAQRLLGEWLSVHPDDGEMLMYGSGLQRMRDAFRLIAAGKGDERDPAKRVLPDERKP